MRETVFTLESEYFTNCIDRKELCTPICDYANAVSLRLFTTDMFVKFTFTFSDQILFIGAVII